jgi:hypothetical protein
VFVVGVINVDIANTSASLGIGMSTGSSGINSAGFHQAKADKNSKTVLLTSMTAKQPQPILTLLFYYIDF